MALRPEAETLEKLKTNRSQKMGSFNDKYLALTFFKHKNYGNTSNQVFDYRKNHADQR